MTEKELKKLNRRELLEMLILQTRKVEELEHMLSETTRQLVDKRIAIRKAGTLAEAAMQLNGVFDAAQSASQQYLENIRRMEEECERECAQILAEARCEARRRRYRIVKRGRKKQL